MRKPQLSTFYNEKMVLKEGEKNFSKSPQKPKWLLEFLEKNDLLKYLEIHQNFEPFTKEDFYIAHTQNYVDCFFAGKKPLAESNTLEWSPQFAETVQYTNASLYEAIKFALQNPESICFSPVSGFHHAQPMYGMGYCTFSGQVIASVKIFRETGMKGAYIDLDGHFGNSIEDSRNFVEDLNEAIPKGFGNINPAGVHDIYINHFKKELNILETAILEGQINYLVFCHGADSHEDDDTKGQCNTQEWVMCAEVFYNFVKKIDESLKKPIPLVLCLFGGYRSDDYNSVLGLHAKDLITCLNTLCGQEIHFEPVLKAKQYP
jgi:acetoin utilization deacetylase AcuC-like enzyme